MDREKTEQSTLGGRVKRYARVSTTMGGLAARMAGEKYLGMKVDRGKHSRDLTEALGGLKGPLMKVAQMLATIPDAVPKEYADQLRQLQADAPAMGWPFVKRRMRSELGPGWQSRFAHFDRVASAAASLGQVHKAELPDGRIVACKLQYPDMQSAVEADLQQLKLILGIFERYETALSTREVFEEISNRLREELDYDLEARHQSMYGEILADEAGVSVPEVVPEFSTGRLLTATWLEGEKVMSFVESHADQRNALAMNMFRAWYVPLYRNGVIHGDPHLGNYSVRPDDGINLLDYGCVRVFPPIFVQGVLDLYNALRTDNRDLAVHAYRTWGFKNLTNELVDVLNIWAGFVYAPIMEDRARPIEETNSGTYGRETAGKVQAELRRIGKVEVPREFVFMDRAALGLGSVFLHLKANINWYRIFQELIADFDLEVLEKRQNALLDRHKIKRPVAGV